jgi:hypothetical protein
MEMNVLYHRDNIDILRRYIRMNPPDLICLDPPMTVDQRRASGPL